MRKAIFLILELIYNACVAVLMLTCLPFVILASIFVLIGRAIPEDY